VRLAISLLILCLASSWTRADVDQEKRIKQILHPDRALAYNPADHTVGTVGVYGTGPAKSKDFNLFQKFRPTAHSTQAYSETKTAWKGDVKFATTAATTDGKHEIHNLDRKKDLKTAATKEAPESAKTARTREERDAKLQYGGPDSKKMNTVVHQGEHVGWKGNLEPMTIDEVRDLLNKPKL
jgi:hypothetical protein